MTSPANQATAIQAPSAGDKPAIIASRHHCEADGVGLSHYILMDRPASPQESAAVAPAPTEAP